MSLIEALKEDAAFYSRLRTSKPQSIAWLCIASPGFFLLATHRVGQRWRALREQRAFFLRRAFYRVLLFCSTPLVLLRTKSDLVADTQIEPGVYLADGGGLIIGARSIGAGSVIHHDVTIGMGLTDQGTPRIGRNVWVGARSVIYGAIEIGDGATILPGSIVSKNIPARALASGNPCRIVTPSFDNSSLLRTVHPDIDVAALTHVA